MKRIMLILISVTMLLIANTPKEQKKETVQKKDFKVSTISSRITKSQSTRKCTINKKLAKKAAKRLAKKEKREAKIKALHKMLVTKSKKREDIKLKEIKG